jgi:hypothetical protein
MILRYSVENYKCFQEKETISFKAKKISESSDTKQYYLLDNDILPIISIYGPNGGGKTSFIESFNILKGIVINGNLINGKIFSFLKNQNKPSENIE